MTATTEAKKSLLMVHGNGGGGFRFSRSLPYFDPAIRVESPTLPGFYPRPADPKLKTLKDYALALLPSLRELPRPRTILGTGIGGSIVLELLQHHAEEVDKVILHAPVGAHLDQRKFPKILKLPGVARLGKNLIGHPAFRPVWRRIFFETDLPKEFVTEFFRGYLNCRSFGQMFDLITQQWFERLKSVETPAVILWGARERLLTLDQKDPFLQVLPNAEVEVVSHWRHFPMVEQPEEFAHKVEELL